jgi:hypothetical protein
MQICKIKNTFLVILTLICVFICIPVVTSAASLSVSPSSSKTTVGSLVNVRVVVGTDSRPINNSEVTLQFPTDLLEVVSVSKGSSVFSMWVEEPAFSNSTGRVTLNGGVPNPGFVGQNGQIISITFKAKKSGSASIILSDSAVRANDGLGTDVLTSKQNGVIQIGAVLEQEVPVVDTESSKLPSTPIVTSSTNPDQNIWYSSDTASFSWVTPSNVTSIQTLLDKSPRSTPTVTYDSSVSQRTVNNLADGVLYFHIRYVNNIGPGPTTHYKVQIDTTAPEKFVTRVENVGVNSYVILDAKDALSGIDSYSIKIDDNDAFTVKSDKIVDGKHLLPVIAEGSHRLVVKAYDRAGNSTEALAQFTSEPIRPPTISVSPVNVVVGDKVEVKGATEYPRTNVLVFVKNEKGEVKSYPIVTSDNGEYSSIINDFKKTGVYTTWSQLTFSKDIVSPISKTVSVSVDDTAFVKTSKTVTLGLLYLILILILLIILICTAFMGWHKFFGLKRQIARDLDRTYSDVHGVLELFKTELNKQLVNLEKASIDKALNKKEEKVFKELENNINNIDEFINKKLKKVK